MPLTLSFPELRTWFRASAPLMGTVAEVVVDADSDCVAAGFSRLRALESRWSRFDPESELNRLHRSAGAWADVSDDLLRALTWAQRMFEETHHIFDPSIRDALEMLGYDRTFSARLDSESRAPATVAAPGLRGLEIDRVNRRVRLAPGLTVDLGGIGKGLAADIVATELVANGARSAYVSLGGDIHACGEPPEREGWPVPLLHPETGAQFAVHLLSHGGLVMSTTKLRTWRRGSQRMHHIVDPRNGRPTETDVIAVAVAAASAARSEALAKAAIVLGVGDGESLLRNAGVRAWIVTSQELVTVAGPA